MGLKFICFLALPVLAHAAGFTYTIEVAPEKSKSKITVRGFAQKVLNEDDRKLFKLRNNDIKDAVKEAVGRRPYNVYINNPTPFGDFEEHNWDEVKKNTSVLSAYVIGVDAVPVIVTTQRLRNYSDKKATYTSTILVGVESTASSTWSKGGEFTAGVEVEYSVQFVTATFSMEYAANWGEETTKSEANVISTSSSVSTELEPGQTALASLTATKGTMRARVEYVTRLIGQVMCQFQPKFQGDQLKGYNVGDIVYVTKAPRFIRTKEDISIGFFSDTDVDLRKLDE